MDRRPLHYVMRLDHGMNQAGDNESLPVRHRSINARSQWGEEPMGTTKGCLGGGFLGVAVPVVTSAMRNPSLGKALLELAMEHEESGAVRRLLAWPDYLKQLRTRRADVDELLLAAETWLSVRSASWSEAQGQDAFVSLSDLLAKRSRDWVDWRWVFWAEERATRQRQAEVSQALRAAAE